MIVAALDLGSNTFLCLIVDIENQQIKRTYCDLLEVVRLGQGLSQSKKFDPEALQRADQCLSRFAKEIDKFSPQKILAVATSAARDAENSEELFTICEKYKIPIEIIAGQQEAVITYQGATSGLNAEGKHLLVIDIGGGSTEFIFGQNQNILNAESFNIGCVRLTEKFIFEQPTPKDQLENARDFINIHVDRAPQLVPKNFMIDEIIAVAGTPTALAAAQLGNFDPKKIDGFALTDAELEKWVERLANASFQQKIEMGIPQGRADVILVGALILLQTLKKFNKNSITVSTRGVRYGVALEIDRRFNLPSNC